MTKDTGYYRMHRGWMDNPAFKQESFTEREAFEWLISEAEFVDGAVVAHNRKPVTLKRGQVPHSIRFMAQAWRWDKTKVNRYIQHLKTWGMIETRSDTGQLIVTICNYDEYQSGVVKSETRSEKQNDTPAGQHRDSGVYKLKEIKQLKEIYTPVFEEAWKAYPESTDMPKRNMSKADAFKKWVAAGVDEADLLRAVRSYAADLQRPNAPMPCHMATWLHQKRYEGPLAEKQAAETGKAETMAFVEDLEPLQRSLCNALSPEVYRSWLGNAQIRDGPEVTILFRTAFQRDHFEQRLSDKAEKAIGKRIVCRTGT